MEQDALPGMTLMLGQPATGDLDAAELRRRIASVPGRGSAPPVIRTLEQYLAQTSLAPLRVAATIFGACAAMAFLLTILGLYGALNESARLRRRELAIRVAFGARRRHVIGQVLRDGGRLAGAGALGGLCGSLLLSRWLIGVMPDSGWPGVGFWLATPALLAVAVAVASLLPARRALLMNPLATLRQDN
jgi:ABC-type antimicrobial peptide transport system permease subunit